MLPRCHDPPPVATTAFGITSRRRHNSSIMFSTSSTTTTVDPRTGRGLSRINFGSPRPPRRWQHWPMRRTD